MNAEDIINHEGDFGRLHPVGKVRKEFICRECKEEFPIGSPAYNQADHRQEGFFPEQTKVCIDCGKIQIENGIEVKKKVKKPKKKKSEGCGEDTCYPKPDGSGDMWKCGEVAPMIGAMQCNKCVIDVAENRSVTIPTKDVGDVKNVYRRECEYKKSLKDRNEDYIKSELGIDG